MSKNRTKMWNGSCKIFALSKITFSGAEGRGVGGQEGTFILDAKEKPLCLQILEKQIDCAIAKVTNYLRVIYGSSSGPWAAIM